ncbi:hypothetical protein J4T77_03345 [Wolbachia endosymbiont of Drosophila innubila]|uniref:hypothetical protein n=1 Tax=Wolbachia endosymbiont of Drosophila innubila TaxID=282263 RepID=UPI001F1C3893|nr:hypothetical protein [Wolbachia endosymbiont of Drosophila innubila]UID81793.1 hypothetical protein J4T77_03345 [Wolbachia endosymbiont of Drosophila innubila]
MIAEFKSRDISPDGPRKQVVRQGLFYHPAILRSEKQNIIVACISFLHDTGAVLVYEKGELLGRGVSLQNSFMKSTG